MNDRPRPEYRAILTADIEDYGSRNDAEQRVLQTALMTSLDRAADVAKLNREQWRKQVGGDSLTAILPAETDVHHLLDVMVRCLDAELGSYNRMRENPAWSRIRLRFAVHVGLIHLDGDAGWPGQHAVLPARLRDSKPARASLAARPEADLVVIVSADVYRDHLTQGPGNPRPSEFREVFVKEKKQQYTAYLYLPRFDVHAITELAPYVDDQPVSDDAAPRPHSSPRPHAPAGGINAGRDVIGSVTNTSSGGGTMNVGGGPH